MKRKIHLGCCGGIASCGRKFNTTGFFALGTQDVFDYIDGKELYGGHLSDGLIQFLNNKKPLAEDLYCDGFCKTCFDEEGRESRKRMRDSIGHHYP